MSDGVVKLGCKHYERGCSIYTACCQKWYSCRLCHNESELHEVNRFTLERMKCSSCLTEQSISNECTHCHKKMSQYFCSICNLFDERGLEKQIFHCNACGLCRLGGRENFFHCQKCGACYSNDLLGKHACVEGSLDQNCAICLEYMFDSRETVTILRCGHAFHGQCIQKAFKVHITCPLCRLSMLD